MPNPFLATGQTVWCKGKRLFTSEQHESHLGRTPTVIRLSCLDDWLTVHRSITLVNFQLDAQNSYLFVYDTFIKILYTFIKILYPRSQQVSGLRPLTC